MKKKLEVFKCFQEFKTIAKNQSGSKIKTLRSARGGEYMLGVFKNFYKSQGCWHQTTVPYAPQQNVAKHKNRTLG